MVTAPRQKNIMPMRRALLLILLSVVVINGTALAAMSYMRYRKSLRVHDAAYNIVALVQTSSHHELLKTGHLPELLGLSVDRPTNLFAFDTQEAERRLKDTVAIKQATVKKIRPGTLHVDYILREPVGFVGNYTNTVVDAEGIMFPLKPYYTPKRLPIVLFDEASLGDVTQLWGKKVQSESGKLAFKILEEAPKTLGSGTTILSIDVSQADAPSFGQRQIVIIVEESDERVASGKPIMVIAKRTLRLFPDNWQHQLVNYVGLRNYLNANAGKSVSDNENGVVHTPPAIIDLRLTNLAFIAP